MVSPLRLTTLIKSTLPAGVEVVTQHAAGVERQRPHVERAGGGGAAGQYGGAAAYSHRAVDGGVACAGEASGCSAARSRRMTCETSNVAPLAIRDR